MPPTVVPYPGQPVNRETIKAAIFARVITATFGSAINGRTTWGLTSRRLKLFNDVDPSVQPALFMVQHRETYETYGSGHMVKRFLDIGLWCYAPTGHTDVIGDQYLDLMESALEATLAPDDPIQVELTLGGLVAWVRITKEDNTFIRDPGDIDGQALLILPIRVLIP